MKYTLQKNSSGMHFIIMLDQKTVEKVTRNNNKRVICTINKSVTQHCSIVSEKEGGHFIAISAKHIKQLKLKIGSIVEATVEQDTSEYQFEMPEELKEVLDTDPEANSKFHSLTPGNQRSLMYLVLQVKTPDKRIDRALIIARKLKAGINSARTILK